MTPKGLKETDHASDSFTVQTINGKQTHSIATDYEVHHNTSSKTLLVVYGDDDHINGPIRIRVYNMKYVISYGWVE